MEAMLWTLLGLLSWYPTILVKPYRRKGTGIWNEWLSVMIFKWVAVTKEWGASDVPLLTAMQPNQWRLVIKMDTKE